MVSPHVDIEQLCSLRHPTDVAAAVADARRLAAAAVSHNGYWRSPWQRPPHFVRRLRSQPWYDPAEFSWAPKLLSAFADIRRGRLRRGLRRRVRREGAL